MHVLPVQVLADYHKSVCHAGMNDWRLHLILPLGLIQSRSVLACSVFSRSLEAKIAQQPLILLIPMKLPATLLDLIDDHQGVLLLLQVLSNKKLSELVLYTTNTVCNLCMMQAHKDTRQLHTCSAMYTLKLVPVLSVIGNF